MIGFFASFLIGLIGGGIAVQYYLSTGNWIFATGILAVFIILGAEFGALFNT